MSINERAVLDIIDQYVHKLGTHTCLSLQLLSSTPGNVLERECVDWHMRDFFAAHRRYEFHEDSFFNEMPDAPEDVADGKDYAPTTWCPLA